MPCFWFIAADSVGTQVGGSEELAAASPRCDNSKSGNVKLTAMVTGSFASPMMVQRFPFDTQTLTIETTVRSITLDKKNLLVNARVSNRAGRQAHQDQQLQVHYQHSGHESHNDHDGSSSHAPLSPTTRNNNTRLMIQVRRSDRLLLRFLLRVARTFRVLSRPRRACSTLRLCHVMSRRVAARSPADRLLSARGPFALA